ncbi:MAG: glycosyltransferase [archaeon]|nr:glycosyltransferase [archaeon]
MAFSISLIIPAYNEEKRLLPVMQNYYDYLKKNFKEFELIIVPNNCADNTPKIAQEFAKKNKNVKVIVIPNFVGKGGAVLEGFKIAKNELIGFIDADESVSTKEFNKLAANIKNFDSAIASRTLKESKIPKKQPISRQLQGIIFRTIVNLLFGLNISDTQCGAKLFKKQAIKKILSQIKVKGWSFDVNILWELKKNNYSIKEVAIEWNDDPNSRVKGFDSLKMLKELIQLRFGG